MINHSVTLDLQGIATKADLHALFKEQLEFPEWYGANWDAFWDCIIAVVPMPAEVQLVHWQEFAAACPRDMHILRAIIDDYAHTKPGQRLVLGPAAAPRHPAAA